MLRRLLYTVMVCLVGAGAAFAQTGSLTGTVTEEGSGEPLVGVNIFLTELQRGATTDAQGEFEITNIEYGTYTMRVSYIGYETHQEAVTISSATNTANVALVSQLHELSDVVVTAFGIERTEESLGYSVERVGGEELSQAKEVNFVSSLTGKVAGAQISSSNAMGGSSRIVLRGSKSITGDNQPLFVIDGVPLDNSNFTTTGQARGAGGYDFGNAASVVDPNNVESVTVLKGPSAAALYGSRARNGVIQIKTKDGSGSQGMGVSVNSGVQFAQVYALADYQDKYGGGANAPFTQIGDQQYVDYGTDESWGPRLDGRPVRQWYSFDDVNGLNGEETPWVAHPDNVKDFFNTGVAFNNNISLSKGAEDYSYRLSFTRLDNQGVFPESELKRNQLGFNGRADFSDKLTGSISVNYFTEEAQARPGTGYDGKNVFLQFNHFGQRQVDLGPNSYMANYARPGGTQRGWNFWGIDGALAGEMHYTDNPYWVQKRNYEEDDTQRIYGNASLTYDFTDYLNVKAELRTDYYTDRRQHRIAFYSQAVPMYREDMYEVQETNARLTFNFNRNLTEEISLDGMVGGNLRYNNRSENEGETQGGLVSAGIYTLENSTDRPDIRDYYQQKQVNSLFANATLGYRDMFFLDGSLRNDWSSTLPDDNNSYLYPALSGSFVFTELDALSSLGDILSFGKIRLGYAQTGSDTDPYRLATTFPLDTPFGTAPRLSVPSRLNNAELKPEITTSWEVGAQLEFFMNRASVDVTFYDLRTRDQIIPLDVSRASGYADMMINAGEVSNRGVEIAASVTPVQLDNGFHWDISANWAKNENKVEELAPGLDNVLIGNAPFQVSVHAREGETYGAIVGTNYQYNENGEKIVDPATGTYMVDGSQQVLGSYQPDWTAGISTSVFYKGFSASVSLDGQKGGDLYSISNAFGRYSGIFEISARGDIRELGLIADGVLPDGSENTVRADPENFFKSLFGLDAANVYDASHIKLREVRLAYSLPVSWFEKTAIRGLTVSAVGRNLATLYKKTPNIDPVNVLSTGNLQGIEAGQIPPQRTYGFNVQLDF